MNRKSVKINPTESVAFKGTASEGTLLIPRGIAPLASLWLISLDLRVSDPEKLQVALRAQSQPLPKHVISNGKGNRDTESESSSEDDNGKGKADKDKKDEKTEKPKDLPLKGPENNPNALQETRDKFAQRNKVSRLKVRPNSI